MRKRLLSILLFMAFLAFAGNTWAQQFKVIKIYDGDTIRVVRKNTEIMVRLVGCDAPEVWKDVRYSGQPLGREAEGEETHQIFFMDGIRGWAVRSGESTSRGEST